MLAKGQTVIQLVEQLAPKHYALPDDKIGLQVGTLNKDIRRILVALDVTEAVADEAISAHADLIVAHHAVIFRPLPHIRTELPGGRLLEKLIKHDIAVYIAHTNLDVAEGGVNDLLADALQLQERSCLEEIHTEKLHKLAVFVPEDHHERVLEALFQAGAGGIGHYTHCSFNSQGTGTFLPGEGTDPYIGQRGKLERVREVRIETIVPQSVRPKAIQAMLAAHPYEEVAYDLYPLDLKGRTFGLGRVGRLPRTMSLEELTRQVKLAFDVPMVRVVGDLHRQVSKAAVLGGSGGRYARHALFAGADVLITGDVDYHAAHDALAAGLALIDAGHNIEKIMKRGVADYLNRKLAEARCETTAAASALNTEVFQFV